MHARRTAGAALTAMVLVALYAPGTALAAGGHAPVVSADVLGIGGLVHGVFSSIGHAVVGALSWTVGLASQFILVTVGALVRLLIPHSWVHAGVQIMRWIVAVPDYAGQVTTPTGRHVYGFAGINDLRDLFEWLGIAIAPLTLIYATTRAMIGDGDPIAIPVLRIAAATIAIASYPYWWTQAAAAADQVTNVILSVPAVSAGLYRLMDYAVAGVALGGWQLMDLGLMAATALALLALIFLKVVLILLGALLYATGPVMIGLIPTRAGAALARAWASAAAMLLGLGIAWATVFAVGALLIGDSTTAGPLIAGNTTFGSLVGGLLLAVAGVASLWVCLKVAREAGAILRMQLSGLLVFAGAGSGGSSSVPTTRARTTGASLRGYAQRLTAAAGAGVGELAVAGPAGARLAAAGRAGALVGRRGLVGTGMAAAGAGAGKAAPRAARMMQRSRAGAVAVRMARAGTAGWTTSRPATAGPREGTSARPKPDGASSRSGSVGRTDHPGVTMPSAGGREIPDTGHSDAPSARPRAPVGAGTRSESRTGDREHQAAAARAARATPDGADSGNATAPPRTVTPPAPQAPRAPVAPPAPKSPPPTAPSPRSPSRDAETSTPPQAPRRWPGRSDGEARG